jgi:DNA-binding transcriptional regulator YiaG
MKLSGRDFGKMIGAPQSTISKWERGDCAPRAAKSKLAKEAVERLYKENFSF